MRLSFKKQSYKVSLEGAVTTQIKNLSASSVIYAA